MEQRLGGRVGQSERVPGNVNKTERVRTKTGSNGLEQRERERVKERWRKLREGGQKRRKGKDTRS